MRSPAESLLHGQGFLPWGEGGVKNQAQVIKAPASIVAAAPALTALRKHPLPKLCVNTIPQNDWDGNKSAHPTETV